MSKILEKNLKEKGLREHLTESREKKTALMIELLLWWRENATTKTSRRMSLVRDREETHALRGREK